MKKILSALTILAVSFGGYATELNTEATANNGVTYIPSEAVKKSQKEFAADRFGIFIHWGIYSMFAQGEWYLNSGIREDEYCKAAKGFYPADFNADEWVKAIKGSGARYVTFTSRHHDGFSMFKTAESDYNIVDGTPFKRDVLKELSEACAKEDIKLHLYYSHLDWKRTDYPRGRTGRYNGRDSLNYNWDTYYKFMNNQLTELLTNYGPIRAIWFDGYWDHDEDSIPFDWQLDKQYEMIHTLQPSCMVANNHHVNVIPGEDIQIFERDVPGENTAGLSYQKLGALPKETCQTMNGMWGYKVRDTDYKDTPTLIRLLVKCAGMGANLLLNVGPQPNGEFPEQSLSRLKEMGEWLAKYGETIYDTAGGDIQSQPWGTTTRKGDTLYVHLLSADTRDLHLPLDCKVKKAVTFDGKQDVKFTRHKDKGIVLHLPEIPDVADYIIELTTK